MPADGLFGSVDYLISVTVIIALAQFCWDLIRTCGFMTCCLTDGTSNLIEEVEALASNILVQFLSLLYFIMVQVFTISFPTSAIRAASVKFSPVADTCHTLQTWLELSSH